MKKKVKMKNEMTFFTINTPYLLMFLLQYKKNLPLTKEKPTHQKDHHFYSPSSSNPGLGPAVAELRSVFAYFGTLRDTLVMNSVTHLSPEAANSTSIQTSMEP